ncbi:hypothetical protein Scep_027075 [Stephania cephalantha]|uniref:Uncharacterized protein n=1 Tax=Stephania cephalantha TaxID=152367 RepID=A0AAP0ELK8_9MAGN
MSSVDKGGEATTAPLLDKEGQWDNGEFTEDGSLDFHGRTALRRSTGGWRAASIVFGVKSLEGLGYYGVATNLAMYLSKVLHQDNASIAKAVTMWTGTCYFTPLLGAYIADSHCGRYRSTLIFALVYFIGMVVVTLSAFLSLLKGGLSESGLEIQKLVFYSGLYLIAFGSGSVNALLLPFGADQFEDGSKVEREKKASFFNWYYFSINIGGLISGTLLVWMEDNIGWALGYGVSAMFVAVAIGMFLAGTPIYRLKRPSGTSPIKRLLQVIVASVRKAGVPVPTDTNLLHEEEFGAKKILHTDGFRFLDKAAVVAIVPSHDVESATYSSSPWMLCTVTHVEELKILLRFVPIWTTGLIYSIAYAQLNSTFVEQGSAMDTKVGPFSVPPASLFSLEVVSAILCVIIYDKFLIRLGKKYVGKGRGISELQRMGVGRFMMILSMAAAAILEWKRLSDLKHGNSNKSSSMSIAWQFPQYLLLGISDVFNFVGMLEFFYSEAPDSMRSICSAFCLLSVAIGNYLSSFLITLVTAVTTRGGRAGWIPANLNEGHLDYFFWLLAAMNALSFVAYIVFAQRHKPKKVIYTLA